MKNQYRLRRANDSDVLDILAWRNQKHVRDAMLTKQVITKDDHLKWWEKKKRSDDFCLLLLEENGCPMAVSIFFNIHRNDSAWWAFYFTSNMSEDMGSMMRVWQIIEYSGLYYSFNKLGLETLYCEVLRENKAVLDWHKRFGFKIVDQHLSLNTKNYDLEVLSYHRKSFQKLDKKYFSNFEVDDFFSWEGTSQ